MNLDHPKPYIHKTAFKEVLKEISRYYANPRVRHFSRAILEDLKSGKDK